MNEDPYYLINGFKALCYSPSENYSCYSYLSYSENIIQTNPERVYLDEGDEYNRFEALDHNVVVTFSRHNLRDGESINLSIVCWDDTQEMFFNKTITN